MRVFNIYSTGVLCLVFGVRVAMFAVSVNGVCVEMVPVLVYIN